MADAQTEARAAVTDDPTVFMSHLQPGDVLVYDSTSFDAGLVQWGDRVPANHVSILLEDGKVIEANRMTETDRREAVRIDPLAPRLSSPRIRSITALRHKKVLSEGVSPAPVLEYARGMLDGRQFSYLQIVALTPAALRRAYPQDEDHSGVLGRAMYFMLDVAWKASQPLLRSNAGSLTCSEFVYRCFDEAPGADLPIHVSNRLLVPLPPPPWLSDAQQAEMDELYRQLDRHDELHAGRSVAVDAQKDPAERITPGDFWRSRSLVPVAVFHRPPDRETPASADDFF